MGEWLARVWVCVCGSISVCVQVCVHVGMRVVPFLEIVRNKIRPTIQSSFTGTYPPFWSVYFSPGGF